MNSNTAETIAEEAPSPQALSWIEAKKAALETACPEALKKTLSEKLEAFVVSDLSVAETKLAVRNLDQLFEQAQKLHQLLGHFETELAQAAQSNKTVETEVELFWAKFEAVALDPNQFKTLENYLKEQFQGHAKETQVVNDVNQKINEEIEPEMQSFLPYYFNSKDRGLIYAEMAKLSSVDNVNLYRQKILKAREKREKYVAKKLQDIWSHKGNPEFGRKVLKLIQKKCGDGVFQLPHVMEAQDLVSNVEEASSEVKTTREDFEKANERYKELTGEDHRHFTVYTNPNPPEVETPKETKAKEVKESKETQIKSLLEARRLLKYSMSFWARANPDLLDDASFSIAGGNRRKALMEQNENLPSVDTYEAQEAKSATLAQAQDATKGLWKYRTVDIPSEVDDFTPDKAQTLLSKLGTYTQGGGDMMMAFTGLWYIDYAKRGGAKAKSISMHEYLSHIDYLLHSLGQPAVTEADLTEGA